jgi:hypothetical protein
VTRLLAVHGELQQVLGIDEVVVAVLAGVDADPVDRAGEGVVTGRVVVADRRA